MNPQNTPAGFELVSCTGYMLVKLKGQLEAESVHGFEEELSKKVFPSPTDVIVDCTQLADVSHQWLRALVMLQKKLKTSHKQIRMVHLPPRVSKYIRQEGLDGTLKQCHGLQEAVMELTHHLTLDVDFINPFIESTLKVLETQASTKAKVGTLYRASSNEKFHGDISGVIAVVSDGFTGTMVISFPSETFLKIMSRMLGEEQTETTKEIEDGAGELTNIIFGQTKIILNEKGYGIKTALPSVVTGQGHSIQQKTKGPRIVLPFETDIGPFFIEICLSV